MARPAPRACRSASGWPAARDLELRLHRPGAAQGRRRARRAAERRRRGHPLPAGRRGARGGGAGRDPTACGSIDASTAHRVAPGWAYGFPEMAAGPARGDRRLARGWPTPAAIRPASSPWCGRWSTAGLVPPDWPLTVNAVSGYSGGGKGDDRRVRGRGARRATPTTPYRLYGLTWRTSTCRRCRPHAGLSHRAGVRARRSAATPRA